MISCKLKGGLGNQMFQIAATFALSKDVNTDCFFDFEDCYTPAQGFESNRYKDNFFKKIPNKKINFSELEGYLEPKFSYTKLPIKNNIYLDGYFQSEKYFEEYKDDIKNLFYFDEDVKNQVNSFLNSIRNNKKITSVHVRRGDYLNNPNYHISCPLGYYNVAMNKIEDSIFVIISDDIEWCKQNFKEKNIFFSEFNSEIFDLNLMIQSDNNIISNSSFSWWGSYLNQNNGLIIAPSFWFGPSGPKDIEDIYNKNWIII